jgi:hypothetical protein
MAFLRAVTLGGQNRPTDGAYSIGQYDLVFVRNLL